MLGARLLGIRGIDMRSEDGSVIPTLPTFEGVWIFLVYDFMIVRERF